jgi:hypothetical protein
MRRKFGPKNVRINGYAALHSDEKDEVRAKKREYQCSHRACVKAKADAFKLIAPSEIAAQKEEARAKIREYQQERYVALPNHKKEKFREKIMSTNVVVEFI